jgi:hypothetical protein
MAPLCGLGRVARKGAFATLVALAVFLGCAHTGPVGQPTGDLTAQSLRSGGLADLGVVQENELAERRPPLVAALEHALAIRTDIPFVPASRAQAMMGDSTARLLLLSYELHGVPEAMWLARAADSLRETARYGILARVESDGIDYTRRDVPVSSAPDAPVTKMYVTERRAKVSVVIYHLLTRSVAYRGEFSGTSGSSVPDTLPRAPSPTPSGGMPPNDAQRRAMAGFRPAEPPSLASAAQDAFAQFVAELPGEAPRPPQPAARADTTAAVPPTPPATGTPAPADSITPAAGTPAHPDSTAPAPDTSPPDTTRH